MLKKLIFRPGLNRENTRYYTESGYYDCDKIRFRQGTPEVIGGWTQISPYTYQGVCRSLWNWITLSHYNYIGVGTNLKFYINSGGYYFDITPIRTAVTLSNPFTATALSYTINVNDVSHGCVVGDFVTFNGATSLGGNIAASLLNTSHQITEVIDGDNYTITLDTQASSSDTGHGGTSVRAVYQINVGPEITVPLLGWGAGGWGLGAWGMGVASSEALRVWSQSNFGEDLIFGPRGGAIYYFTSAQGVYPMSVTMTIASPTVLTTTENYSDGDIIYLSTTDALPTGLETGTPYYVRNAVGLTFNVSTTPSGALINTSGTQSGTHSIVPTGVLLSSFGGASDVPVVQNYLFVSDIYRFVFAFGANDYGTTTQDPMLIRWSDQEDALQWTPSATNQAGSLRLSHGSEIVTVLQTRQELVVFTDSSVYSLQYLGPPYVWSAQLLGDSTSIVSQNAVTTASGITYWMGVDKFYKYDGRVQTLRCDLRNFIFSDFNKDQGYQVCAGTNEGFNEVWWFYCTANSTTIDRYVVYNYIEDIWYYGTMDRSAWLDSGTLQYPIGATYSNNIVYHEYGLNDGTATTSVPIYAYITTSEFDIDDGHNFGFIRRILPDLTFRGSTATSPSVTMSVIPLDNSGSGYTDPASVGGSDNASIVRTATVPIEQFTGQVFIRVRGRQFSFKVESNQLDTTWQFGATRIDWQPDGRRST